MPKGKGFSGIGAALETDVDSVRSSNQQEVNNQSTQRGNKVIRANITMSPAIYRMVEEEIGRRKELGERANRSMLIEEGLQLLLKQGAV